MLSILCDNLEAAVKNAEEFVTADASQYVVASGIPPILGLIFDEPSTRTRFSTAAAAERLGCRVLYCDDLQLTSTAKGESIADTAEVLSCYFDLLAVRSRLAGLPRLIAASASIPVLNLGDGVNEHPTEALSALVTIRRVLGEARGKHIVVWGDLECGRVAHSVFLAAVQIGMRVTLCPAAGYFLPEAYLHLARLVSPEAHITTVVNAEEIDPSDVDVLYLTREQAERRNAPFPTESYFLNSRAVMDGARLVLHPLPRGPELAGRFWENRKAEVLEHVKTTYSVRQWVVLMSLRGDAVRSRTIRLRATGPHNVCSKNGCAASNYGVKVAGVRLGGRIVCEYCLWYLKDP